MTEEMYITVEGIGYPVVISDDSIALAAAKAAGRAIIGLWDPVKPGSLSPADYVIDDINDVDHEFLERVVRRNIRLPWMIGETDRLVIREFQMSDALHIPARDSDAEDDKIFYTPDKLKSYLETQYQFFEYGIWAVLDKETGRMVGKAGISAMESIKEFGQKPGIQKMAAAIGYHIFEGCRRKGYAEEACRFIMEYARVYFEADVCALIDDNNIPSVKLVRKLGFMKVKQQGVNPGQSLYLFRW